MNFDKYKNNLPFPVKSEYEQKTIKEIERLDKNTLTVSKYNEEVKKIKERWTSLFISDKNAYQKANKLLNDLFLSDCEEYFNFKHLPENVKSAIHSFVWDKAHSGGFSELFNYYFDVIELVEKIIGNKK